MSTKTTANPNSPEQDADNDDLSPLSFLDEQFAEDPRRAEATVSAIIENIDWAELPPKIVTRMLAMLHVEQLERGADIGLTELLDGEREMHDEQKALDEISAMLVDDPDGPFDPDVADEISEAIREGTTLPAAKSLPLIKRAIAALDAAEEHGWITATDVFVRLGSNLSFDALPEKVRKAVMAALIAVSPDEMVEQCAAPALVEIEKSLACEDAKEIGEVTEPTSGRADITLPFDDEDGADDEDEDDDRPASDDEIRKHLRYMRDVCGDYLPYMSNLGHNVIAAEDIARFIEARLDVEISTEDAPSRETLTERLIKTLSSLRTHDWAMYRAVMSVVEPGVHREASPASGPAAEPEHIKAQRRLAMSIVHNLVANDDPGPLDNLLNEGPSFSSTAWSPAAITTIMAAFIANAPAKCLGEVVKLALDAQKSHDDLESDPGVLAGRVADAQRDEFAAIVESLSPESRAELIMEARRRVAASKSEAADNIIGAEGSHE